MNILIISNDNEFAHALSKKLVFLRKSDIVKISSYKEAINEVEIFTPNIVLVHENTIKTTTNLIKKIGKNKCFSIMLMANSLNSDLILSASDNGIDDFVLSTAEDFELVIRIINNAKHNSTKLKLYRNEKILEQLKVIDELTGIYSYNYAKQVIENAIDEDLVTEGSFVVLSPSNNSKIEFSAEKFTELLKTLLRCRDIITLGRGNNFYLFLPETNMNGAIAVINKISEQTSLEICAGITDISGKSFNEFEHSGLKAVAQAIATNAEYVIAEDKTEDIAEEWLDNGDKNYKIFRQMFKKKLEKVIIPVFYALQESYDGKLFNTKIEQYTVENLCVFNLRNKKSDSSLKIIYPGFAKVIVSIEHEGLDSPENKQFDLKLSEITQSKLTELIENFIKEFKSR